MAHDIRTYRGYGRRRYSGRRMFLITLLTAIVVFAVTGGLLWLFGRAQPEGKSFQFSGPYDQNAVVGTLYGQPAGDLKPVDEFEFRINPNMTVEGGKADIEIENPVGNRALMRVTLTLDTGETVYTSGLIKPYHYIEAVKLEKTPAKGSHPGAANIEVCDKMTLQVIGRMEQPVTLTVK